MELDRPDEPAKPPAEQEARNDPEAEHETETKHEALREWQPRLYLSLLGLGLIVAYAIAFVLENNKHVSLHFVFTTTRVSLIWLILLSIAIGMLAGVLFSQLYRRRRRRD